MSKYTLLRESRAEWSSFDYYLVIDVDVGSSSSFTREDFLTNFVYSRESWLAMTATQKSEYYDIWALRLTPILSFDCWQKITELKSFFLDRTYRIDRLIRIRQKAISRSRNLIKVQSAFGGAALYNGKYLHRTCSYTGQSTERSWWQKHSICEHVPFHQCLQKYLLNNKGQQIEANKELQQARLELSECSLIAEPQKLNSLLDNVQKLAIKLFQITKELETWEVNLPTNADIQNTFRNFKNDQIISSVDYLSKANLLYCHVYSYPCTWTFYGNITNNFPGGLFKYVREISLRDERPFEHEFFLRIAQSFQFIKKLTLNNREPQQNDNLQWLIIEYPHLIELDLAGTHENYVEEFLNNTKTCLLNNVYLRVGYDSLKKVTDDFTRDATRINCSKIVDLVLSGYIKDLDDEFVDYFPLAQMYSSL